jgi:hypothetical protein
MKLPYHCSSFWLIAGTGMERFAPKREPKTSRRVDSKPVIRNARASTLQIASFTWQGFVNACFHVGNGGTCPRTRCTNSCPNERWSLHSWMTGV